MDVRERETAVPPVSLALACVGFLASAGAHAEIAGDATDDQGEGGRITVTGQHQDGYKVDADNAKITARLIDTPRSIVVVPQEVIKETGSATLVDALRTVPGITFGAAEGGNPIGDRPFIRGFDSQGSTYLDGVRDIGAQTREVFDIEQIQVVRGSDSTLGGRGSAGGTLNIVSKAPRLGTFAEVDGSYGTADYKRLTGDVNIQLAPTIGFRLNAMWHDQDVAGRDAIFSKRWGIAPSLTIGLGTPTRLNVSYYHLHTDELPDSGIPYLYTAANAPLGEHYSEPAIGDVTLANGTTGHVSRDTFYGLKDRDFRKSNTDQATLRVEHDFGSLTLRNTSRYSHTWQGYIFLLPDDSTGNVFGTTATNSGSNLTSGGYVWRRANTRYGYTDSIVDQADLYGSFETGRIKHAIAAGVEISWEKARRGTYVTPGYANAAGTPLLSTGSTITPRCNATTVARYYCTSLFDPNPNDPWINYASDTSSTPAPIVKSGGATETQNDANSQGVYAFDSITLAEPLILNLGARYDRFESKVTPGLPVTTTKTFTLGRVDRIFNWQAGLVYKPTHSTSVYASYATAATPPNSLLGEGSEGNGLGTTNSATALGILDSLKVERTKSYEVGAKADLLHDALSLTLALFRTETKNARVTVDANTVAFVGERRVKGAEFGFNGKITPAWSVFGGYTYLDARIVDGGFATLTAPAVVVAGKTIQPAQIVAVPSVNTGRRFPQTAKHSFTAWTDYRIGRFSIGGGAFYSSRVFGGYADNRAATQNAAGVVTVSPATRIIARSVPSYWRFDARAGFEINKAIEISVNVQNLTDKTYFSQAYASHYATIAPGRSAFATLAVRY